MSLLPFDDRDGWIWMDGEFLPWREAKLHVLTHGLHYASGIFEGERCYAGNIFKLREHTERLIRSGRLLGFEIPFTADEIDAASIETVRRNGHTDAYVRPVAWRGSEMLAVSAQRTKIHLAIACWGWPNLFGENRMKGVRLGMARWRRPAPDTAPTASKASGLYMIGTLSKHAAEAEGFDDAMMLDFKGDVAEATGANAFFVFDGELHTPTPICFLDGITRRTVMRLARNRQMKVVERTIRAEELPKATEVFLAGTAAEVTPVRAIGEYAYTPGQITETLLSDYEKLVRMSPEEVHRLAA
ncbi:Branched-chain amino acid aminotransferase [Roseomonas mucosa]|uniref:Branched-chain-amino-acid aminotransferase n=1 Tax=Roseomonas mucosa TaxID=207340 RepID=A0A1S8CYY6_9PROT|nr:MULTISPECIES: branched-chain amino acid aminotransferase [Roseomonas]MBS5903253.1 branched-chain amino acid aminotransferase [Acetobacteraceae bacterium]MCG7354787.1 branched-chain amino acid aminotransferase [Roseomonas mucosa]MCG7359348.1 branched-chain amino acid aminotransferase [Roseomonas mucosa]MDT8290415.1 branched-chain amino acid aminotransferase [Roseomonas mucosa]MDT8294383.1 branched-chain amino acid aminotransferase [Roseomonas mucosa]